MSKWKRLFAVATCALVAVAGACGFGACNGGGDPGKDNTPQPTPPTDEGGNVITEVDPNITATIQFGYLMQNSEESIAKGIADSFTKKFPNVTVTLVPYSGSSSYTELMKLYKANKMPDVFMTNSFDMLSFDESFGAILELDPYIEQEEKDGKFSKDDYYAAYLKLGQRNFDGAQLMISRAADRVVVHYNKALIAQAEQETGLEIQKYIKNGWTWDDFDIVCAALKQSSLYANSNIVDFNMDWEAVYNPILQYYGVKYFENDDLAFDSEAGHKALDFFKNWADKGYAPRSKDKAADFDYGEGAMHFQSRAVSETIKNLHARKYTDKPLDSDWSDIIDVVTMPVFADNPLIGAGAAGYCAYKNTQNPALVWQFLKHIISREGQNAIADTGNNLVPVRKDMADYKNPDNHWGKGFENLNLSAYTYNAGGEGEEDWNCYTDYFFAASPRFAVAMNDAFGLMIQGYAGGTPYDASMKALRTNITRILRSS